MTNLRNEHDWKAECEKLALAARNITPYLRWTIGPESPGYHPTMPSAVDEFATALANYKALQHTETEHGT